MEQQEIDKMQEINLLRNLRNNYQRQKVYFEVELRKIDLRIEELIKEKQEEVKL